jgi:hypothetical protein
MLTLYRAATNCNNRMSCPPNRAHSQVADAEILHGSCESAEEARNVTLTSIRYSSSHFPANLLRSHS